MCSSTTNIIRFNWCQTKLCARGPGDFICPVLSIESWMPFYERLTRTCLRICAAIWWLQSKMMRNSRLLFISLRRGLVSCESRGSWRIFSLMLYLDGAMISSWSLIRPEEEKQHNNDGTATQKLLWQWGTWRRFCNITVTLYSSTVNTLNGHQY